MRNAYYNENDAFAAQWLRNLIAAGHIAPGDVDERSIVDVQPDDLRGYAQCHFFAGIGGWSLALRLAGWPDDRPVWTGSCPCQPLSGAGQRKGHADKRHLWPAFHSLIAECAPAIVFGEQVASPDGREWLAGVRADLETLGYAVRAADLCAAGETAPHARQRLYWMADADEPRRGLERFTRLSGDSDASQRDDIDRRGAPRRLAHADGGLAGNGRLQRGGEHGQFAENSGSGGLGDAESGGRGELRDAARPRRRGHADGANAPRYWDAFDILWCTDAAARRIEPGSFPLAHGVPGRMGRLRAYGNAIVPQAAATFIRAVEE